MKRISYLLIGQAYLQELRGEDPAYTKDEFGGDHKSFIGLSQALQGVLALNFSQDQPDPHSGA